MSTTPRTRLTVPDLVVLGLLCERPMHGYEVVVELERREVRDWAGVSRPQVYYSLAKLARARLIRSAHDDGQARGPERTVYQPAASAKQALAEALARDDWSTQRPPPPFLTWVALSSHARRPTVRKQIARRRRYLTEQLEKERLTLVSIAEDPGPQQAMANAVVELGIRQLEVELGWLDELERVL